MGIYMLSSQPLIEHIERKVERHGSLNALAANICHQLGLDPQTCSNALLRIRRKKQISLFAADRFATALDVHLIDLYGFEEYARHVDMSDVDVMTEEECC